MLLTRRNLWTIVAMAHVAGSTAQGQAWSQDGRWVAHVTTVRGDEAESTWLFADGPLPGRPVRGHRLWATWIGDDRTPGKSVLLAESDGLLGPPAWKRDGTGLAYARTGADDRGRGRVEIVAQETTQASRVLFEITLSDGETLPRDPETLAVDWSPDGRFLAASLAPRTAVVVLRVQDGAVVTTIPGAVRPAWAPDGSRLAFARGGESPGIYVHDRLSSETERIIPGSDQERLPSPVWTRDGTGLIRVAFLQDLPPTRSNGPGRAGAGVAGSPSRLRVERIELKGRQRTTIHPIAHEAFDRVDDILDLSLSQDRDSDQFFYSLQTRGGAPVIAWLRGQGAETVKRFNPLPGSIAIGRVELSPRPISSSRPPALALRVHDDAGRVLTCLCNPTDETIAPLVPDESARLDWMELLLGGIGTILEGEHQGDEGDSFLDRRPSRLPSPAELDPEDVATLQLRRLARIGRLASQSSPESDEEPGSGRRRVDEAELTFHYLLGDFDVCLASLEQQPFDRTPDERLRVLGLRAQVFWGQARPLHAAAIVDYLKQAARVPRSLEEWPDGRPILGPESATGWPDRLGEQLAPPVDGGSTHAEDVPTLFLLDLDERGFQLEP